MSDQDSRSEDLERTDVLPQLSFEPDTGEENETDRPAMLAAPKNSPVMERHSIAPYGRGIQSSSSANGQLHRLPAKPSPTDLAVGGIRGKISDLENKLLEAQDNQSDLNRQCEQLANRCRTLDERAIKAEASFVTQTSELYRTNQRATDAEQRLAEQRVRLEAQIVDIERQLVEARTRAEKRIGALEQLLNEQTDRAAQSDSGKSELWVAMETLRAELGASQQAIKGLEARLVEQTKAAEDISRRYAQQTGDYSSVTTEMAEAQKALAGMQGANAASEAQIAELRGQLRLAQEATAKHQSDLEMKQRHISALEHGLEHRDVSIDAFKAKIEGQERANLDVSSAKSELEQRCAELQATLAEVQKTAAGRNDELTRLNSVVQHYEQRVNAMTAAQQNAEQKIRDRDTVINQATAQTKAARQEFTQSTEHANSLQARLDKQELDISALQSELQMRRSELEQARVAAVELLTTQKELQGLQESLSSVMSDRAQLEAENQSGRTELVRAQQRYEDAVKTIIATRESISAREHQNASLDRELRAALLRLDDAQTRIAGAAVAAQTFDETLRERDSRINALEQQLAEHASALAAIEQDIERVDAANPNERIAAIGYALESLDSPGLIHRLTRATTTAGRSDSNDIAINSTSVSRYHARIVVKPEGVWLIDLQSTNGCGVNGRRTARQILCDGDAVQIGHCRYRFSVLGADASKILPKVLANDEIPLIEETLFAPGPATGGDGENRLQRH